MMDLGAWANEEYRLEGKSGEVDEENISTSSIPVPPDES